MSIHVEVCVDQIESARRAQEGGAHAVELCVGLNEGGVTPSIGLIQTVLEELHDTSLGVLIRPRAGDFVFSAAEQRSMLRDVEAAREAGCHGVAVGALTAEGDIDVAATRSLLEAAGPLTKTFHRAFDRVRDPQKALDQLLALEVDRVLTSGQAGDAEAGIPRLRELVEQAGTRLTIVPAGAIRLENAAHILQATGARALHVGSAVARRTAAESGGVGLGPGGRADHEGGWAVKAERVQQLVRSLRA